MESRQVTSVRTAAVPKSLDLDKATGLSQVAVIKLQRSLFPCFALKAKSVGRKEKMALNLALPGAEKVFQNTATPAEVTVARNRIQTTKEKTASQNMKAGNDGVSRQEGIGLEKVSQKKQKAKTGRIIVEDVDSVKGISIGSYCPNKNEKLKLKQKGTTRARFNPFLARLRVGDKIYSLET